MGSQNSVEKINRLAINKYLAMGDCQDTAIAISAAITRMNAAKSRKSAISEKKRGFIGFVQNFF
jgi:hypothetical protein